MFYHKKKTIKRLVSFYILCKHQTPDTFLTVTQHQTVRSRWGNGSIFRINWVNERKGIGISVSN